MKVLKYIASVFVLAAATLAALYLPSIYFQKYEYETVIEEMEQHAYEGPNNKASLWQISQMLKDLPSYKKESIYKHKAETKAEELERGYLKIVRNIFEKYIKSVEEDMEYEGIIDEAELNTSELHNMLRDWMTDWMKEEEYWQVDEVWLYNLVDVFSGELIYIQLYDMYLTLSDNIHMEICFSPDTQIFYTIFIIDYRYIFEKNTDEIFLELYIYYKKQVELNDILEDYWKQLLNIETSENTLFVGIVNSLDAADAINAA